MNYIIQRLKTKMKEKDQKRESLKQDTFALILELQDVLSLRQIAINTDLSPSTIGYWMKGDVNPSVKSLKTVYDYLLDYKLKRDAKSKTKLNFNNIFDVLRHEDN